jgi:serine/threonine protein kinase
MQCPACGQPNKPDARFCASCGAVLDADLSTLQPGQLMDGGTYRIIRPLGKGGMGAVYLAANTKAFERVCVVKEVIQYYDPSNPDEVEKALQRFESEARTLAALKHSGIPDIYAYFTERGRNYLVMEYIEGANLAQGLTREENGQVIAGHPMPVEDVVRYMAQICEVLVYLEQCQPPVIHNDIKPANIILDKNSGRAVLVDFGTAKTRYAQQAKGRPGTQHSSVYGTVGYAAPELYEGKAEPRSDVHALAVTAYHLMTDDDPRVHPFDYPRMDAVPEALRPVLADALQADVTLRLSAAEFGRRLGEAMSAIQGKSQVLALALTFPNGQQATTREELVALCVKNWEYAAGILYDHSIENWLRTSLHDVAAAKVAQAAQDQYVDDPNAGLDCFIRSLDPKAMPWPRLQVLSSMLRYDLSTGGPPAQAVELTNAGGGYLYGTAVSSAEWLQVEKRIGCPPGRTYRLPVSIDLGQLRPGTYTAKIDIQASGAQTASIPVEVRIPPPVIEVVPRQVDLGAVSRQDLLSGRASFEVRNKGMSRADCQIEGGPPWLILGLLDAPDLADPRQFACMPGSKQVVEMTARVDKLPPTRNEHLATLRVQVAGGQAGEVQVTLHVGSQARTARRVELHADSQARSDSKGVSFLLIGIAVLALLGAIAFFVVRVLLMP